MHATESGSMYVCRCLVVVGMVLESEEPPLCSGSQLVINNKAL